MKKISMLLVCLIGALTAYAAEPYDFKADSLFYRILDANAKTVAV